VQFLSLTHQAFDALFSTFENHWDFGLQKTQAGAGVRKVEQLLADENQATQNL